MLSQSLAPRLSDVTMKGYNQDDWQQKAIGKIADIHNQAFQERWLLMPKVFSFAKPAKETVLPWLTGLTQKVCQVSSEEAQIFARKILPPKSAKEQLLQMASSLSAHVPVLLKIRLCEKVL